MDGCCLWVCGGPEISIGQWGRHADVRCRRARTRWNLYLSFTTPSLDDLGYLPRDLVMHTCLAQE